MTPDGIQHCGCGGRPASFDDHADGGFFVECLDCGTMTRTFEKEAEAKAAWNAAVGAGR